MLHQHRCLHKVKPDYFSARADGSDSNISHAFNMTPSESSYDEEFGLLMCQMDWSVVAKKGRAQLLKLVGQYIIYYSGVPSVGSQFQNAFIQNVGKFATYPYFRTLVSQMSWSSGAELPVLPVLKQNIPPKAEPE